MLENTVIVRANEPDVDADFTIQESGQESGLVDADSHDDTEVLGQKLEPRKVIRAVREALRSVPGIDSLLDAFDEAAGFDDPVTAVAEKLLQHPDIRVAVGESQIVASQLVQRALSCGEDEQLGFTHHERFALETNPLGKGGCGKVDQVYIGGQIYARKTLFAAHGNDERSRQLLERFCLEARVLAMIPHGIAPRPAFSDGHNPKESGYFLMDFVDGAPLSRILENVDPKQDNKWLLLALAGFAHSFALLHDPQAKTTPCKAIDDTAVFVKSNGESGIVHRDIKPSNLMICRDGGLKILDLGLARVIEDDGERLTKTGNIMGTQLYTAPEAFGDSKHVTGDADVYSLGVILFEVLTGQHPYSLAKNADVWAVIATVCDKDSAPAFDLVSDTQLKTLLMRMLAKEPPRPSMSEVANVLLKAAGSLEAAHGFSELSPGERKVPIPEDILNRALDNNDNRSTQTGAGMDSFAAGGLPAATMSMYEPCPGRGYRRKSWSKRHPRLAKLTSFVGVTAAVLSIIAFTRDSEKPSSDDRPSAMVPDHPKTPEKKLPTIPSILSDANNTGSKVTSFVLDERGALRDLVVLGKRVNLDGVLRYAAENPDYRGCGTTYGFVSSEDVLKLLGITPDASRTPAQQLRDTSPYLGPLDKYGSSDDPALKGQEVPGTELFVAHTANACVVRLKGICYVIQFNQGGEYFTHVVTHAPLTKYFDQSGDSPHSYFLTNCNTFPEVAITSYQAAASLFKNSPPFEQLEFVKSNNGNASIPMGDVSSPVFRAGRAYEGALKFLQDPNALPIEQQQQNQVLQRINLTSGG